MKKLIALIMLAFIGYQCINSMNPSKKRAAESQEESNKRARTATVILLTSDGDAVSIPQSLAEKSSYITGMIASLGNSDEPIPLPDIDREEIVPIIAMLTEIDNANQAFIKPHGERYIPQRIQPIINQTFTTASPAQLVDAIQATEFLDLGYLTNGLIRILVENVLADFPMATIETIQTIQGSHGSISVHLRPLIEYQYKLIKNGNIPELSIADYSAINGMPHISFDDIDLSNKNLTSIEGLLQISGIENVDRIYLQKNKIVQLPRNAFQRLANLRTIDLDQNLLTELPATLFQGLQKLESISIISNQLTTLPETLFRGLTRLKRVYLKNNRLMELSANLFRDCRNLKDLNLISNRLTTLPATLFQGLTDLAIISLTQNQLTELPETLFQGLINLRILDVTNNRLTRLPATLFECPELRHLDYSRGNEFTQEEKTNIRHHLERLYEEQRIRRRQTMWGDQFLD